MAMKGCPSSRLTSYMEIMLGWRNLAAMRASLRNRFALSGSLSSSGNITFNATYRFTDSWAARWTVDIPPSPSDLIILYPLISMQTDPKTAYRQTGAFLLKNPHDPSSCISLQPATLFTDKTSSAIHFHVRDPKNSSQSRQGLSGDFTLK